MADQKIGTVSHYYNHLGVAIIDVESPIAVGDNLKFVRHGDHQDIFTQQISSIQIEHEKIEKADKGQSVGIKVDQIVHEGVEVYKVV